MGVERDAGAKEGPRRGHGILLPENGGDTLQGRKVNVEEKAEKSQEMVHQALKTGENGGAATGFVAEMVGGTEDGKESLEQQRQDSKVGKEGGQQGLGLGATAFSGTEGLEEMEGRRKRGSVPAGLGQRSP